MFSPVDPHMLYLGSNVLFKTTDGGQQLADHQPRSHARRSRRADEHWQHDREADPAQGKHRGVIYSLAPSPQDVNLIWAGTDDGLIQLTRDGGKNWSEVTPPGLTPWSKIAQLDASHFDRQYRVRRG